MDDEQEDPYELVMSESGTYLNPYPDGYINAHLLAHL